MQLDIPKPDPLHDMKLEILQRYFVPPTKDVKHLKHSMNFFTIRFALMNFLFVPWNYLDILDLFFILIPGFSGMKITLNSKMLLVLTD